MTEPKIKRGHDVPIDIASALQEHLDALWRDKPADHDVLVHLSVYRHPCKKARMSGPEGRAVSTPIQLQEKRIESGKYALLYREGTCHRCGQTARSRQGLAVESLLRPPLHGRVARG